MSLAVGGEAVFVAMTFLPTHAANIVAIRCAHILTTLTTFQCRDTLEALWKLDATGVETDWLADVSTRCTGHRGHDKGGVIIVAAI